MTEWILTKELKPKPNTNVLITFLAIVNDKKYKKEIYKANWDGCTFYIYQLRVDWDESRVPAWMPLPEPYKEEKTDA